MDLEFLSSVSIFSDLSDSELDNIKTLCQTRKYPKNSMIILEEEMGDVVFIVMSGTVKITRVNDEGKEVILAMLGSGEVFGEMAILDGESRSANALAQEAIDISINGLYPEITLEDVLLLYQNLFNIDANNWKQTIGGD